jgi:solute carrier family 13 (sodium-dependent dicarboxylate transporter), member 2/3/5
MKEDISLTSLLRNNTFQFILGLFLFVLMVIFANMYTTEPQIYYGVAILFLAVYMWLLTPVSFIFSTFLIITASVFLGILPQEEAFRGFSSGTLFFLMGAFILAITVEKHDLHKRIALSFLNHFGSSPKRFLLGVTLVGFFLSMLMPEHGIAALFIPILFIVFVASKRKNILKSNFGKANLLALSYGTSVGSIATFLGGARNILAVEIYSQYTGETVSFIRWTISTMPVALTMIIFTYLVLAKLFKLENIDMEHIRMKISDEITNMGNFSIGEKKALVFLIGGFIAWATIGQIFGMGIIAIALAVAIASTRTISWSDVESKMPWGTLFLYVGAVTLSIVLPRTGTLNVITDFLLSLVGDNPFIILAMFTIITIFLSDVMSNASVTAIILPLALSTMGDLGLPPIVPMYTIAMASGFAFLLPVGTPSAMLVYATGNLDAKDFIKPGFILNVLGIIVFLTVGLAWWRILGYW